MYIHICTHNSKGLINDAEILKEKFILEHHNVELSICEEINIMEYSVSEQFDKQFFLEHIYPCQLKYSCENIYIPNIEMINNNDIFQLRKDSSIKIFCKTNFCYNILKQIINRNSISRIIWNSKDRQIKNITPDFNEYLHVKGQSRFKNSQMILDLWSKHPDWPNLTIVHNGIQNKNGYLNINVPFKVANNITIYQKCLSENELNILMNKCGFHICPSSMEGYGHYINEARSTSSIILTTNYPPMNSFITEEYGIKILVKKENLKKFGLSVECIITEKDLENSILQSFELTKNNLKIQSKIGRTLYETNSKRFYEQIL